MNAAGQIILEYILLLVVFFLLIAKISTSIPSTFSTASPYLGAKVEQRLMTGGGFASVPIAQGFWKESSVKKGGVK